MMNKINIENSKIILDKESPYYLNISKNIQLEIKVLKNISTKLIIVGNSDYQINLILEDNSKLIINSLNKNNNVNIDIHLYQNSSITYNHSILANIDCQNSFSIKHLNDGSTSILNNNGINLSNEKLFFTINGYIPKDLHDISCNQNSRIINYCNGNSKIIPNLIVDSNDIIANHSAYIGKIDSEILFYLESRGIEIENIKKLFYKATLLGKMELLEEKEEFNNLINEWW